MFEPVPKYTEVFSSVVQQWERTIFTSFQVRSKERVSPWNSSVNWLGSSENQPKQVQHWLRLDKEKGVWTRVIP